MLAGLTSQTPPSHGIVCSERTANTDPEIGTRFIIHIIVTSSTPLDVSGDNPYHISVNTF